MSLELILEQMADATMSGDTEAAHADADRLLVKALETLAPDNHLVQAIITAYGDVDKWYA